MNLHVQFVEPRGNVVRNCPGTKAHICCGYKTIDIVEGCPLLCSYCILRGYLNREGIYIIRDKEYVINQIKETIDGDKSHILRFGTGELSDSLALDKKYEIHKELVEFFGETRRAILELKSKWAYIDHLLSYLNLYTVVSFSISTARIVREVEKRTSPLKKRIKILRKIQDIGLFVGLHFDPIIIYEGFERDYENVVNMICEELDLKRIIWISLGLLRFPKDLYFQLLKESKPILFDGEFIKGEDGKFRYLKRQRIRVYRFLHDLLKEKENSLFIYLCMERKDVWKEALGIDLEKDEDLKSLFDNRIKTFYGGRL